MYLSLDKKLFRFLFNNYLCDFVKGLSNSLNERLDALKSDFVNANKQPDYYDTDIENFWTNPSKNSFKLIWKFDFFLDKWKLKIFF
jgi:hypothetical protein